VHTFLEKKILGDFSQTHLVTLLPDKNLPLSRTVAKKELAFAKDPLTAKTLLQKIVFVRGGKSGSGQSPSPHFKSATPTNLSQPGLPDFSWYNVPKRGKIYQITIK
jgi:hypothetical protein